jgi:hypothetical protein
LLDALEQIFDQFGHYVPATVTLGGVQNLKVEVVSYANQTSADVETKRDFALSFKAKGGSGDVKVGYDKGTGEEITAKNIIERYEPSCTGGGMINSPATFRPGSLRSTTR